MSEGPDNQIGEKHLTVAQEKEYWSICFYNTCINCKHQMSAHRNTMNFIQYSIPCSYCNCKDFSTGFYDEVDKLRKELANAN